MSAVYIFVLRDPDSPTEWKVFPDDADASVVSVDYGYADLSDNEEFDGWAEGLRETANEIEKDNDDYSKVAAEYLRELVDEAVEAFGHEGRWEL